MDEGMNNSKQLLIFTVKPVCFDLNTQALFCF